ncbi:MAG: tRNA (adenosine(37)-N6)-threonylcarbamoyltransferase complex dimerization subunit type 1 TsaB [Candidatus Saccharicenans sp.]|uniref:tRNA (adenosine(37)-N6)-threonylcarbamoyltransferase complex dimerization subunit type 1 TsaB n=1 Tax=Candidatus Saccharicenans sp. TaxID=2819258 RepID=UPI00404B4093
MLILAVDTTTRFGSVALVSGEEVLAEVNYASPSSHSRQVFRAVDDIIRLSGLKFDQIEGLAVAAGPGSFTGIRIGLSLVKALALASDRPLAAVSALEALASKLILPGSGLIVPMIDARKGEVFAGAYIAAGGELEEVLNPGAFNPSGFLIRLPDSGSISFIGTGAELYRSLIEEKFGARALFWNRSFHIAAEVGRLGQKLLAASQGLSPADLQPIYYRQSQAEEKKTVRTE